MENKQSKESPKSPLVSVLIPAYNEEKYIETVLKAILCQDYPKVEILVIDNASTDKTFETAQKFPTVHVLQEKKKGTNFALELGRKKARGEFIARIDADCIPDKEWITRATSHFTNSNISSVTGPYEYYDGDRLFKIFWHYYQRYVYSTINWMLQFLHKGALLVGGNSMMRASHLEKIGGFNTSIVFYGDDTDLAKKLSKIGAVIFDKKLTMKSSARRFKKEGFLKIIYFYTNGFLKMTFRK